MIKAHFADEKSCDLKTKQWISEHSLSEIEEFQAEFMAEQEMFNIGLADSPILPKTFWKKKMLFVQLKQ